MKSLGESTGLEIVGVVADTLESPSDNPYPTIFYPFYSGSQRSGTLAVRTEHGPVEPRASGPAGHRRHRSEPRRRQRPHHGPDSRPVDPLDASFDATLLFAFAVISLLLAAVGLFGVLSYIVAQRTTEIGIRIALGAQREQVMRLMLRDGLRPAIFGLVLGLVASAGAAHLIQSCSTERQLSIRWSS